MPGKPTASTQKGARTRRHIVETAKKLFYDKGYSETAVIEICRAAEVKPGTMTYYFKTKYDLVKELYESVYRKCYEFVEDKLGRQAGSLEKNTIVAFVYYQAVCADENTRRFHLEILKKSRVTDFISKVSLPVARSIFDELKAGFSEKEAGYVELAWNGISREMFIDYLTGPEGREVQDVVNTIYIFRARLLTADENAMKVYLYNGMELSRNCGHSHITLLGPGRQP